MNRRRGSFPTDSFALAFALAVLGAPTCFVACNGETTETTKERICTPGNYVFCRCKDRSEGSKLCNDDGTSFAACEPCGDMGELPPDEPFEPDPDQDASLPGPLPVCGNGIVEQDEDCDDANEVESDGCDAQCRLAGTNPAASRSCPGMPVHVWGTREVSYVGTTIGAPVTTGVDPNCTSGVATSGNAGAERILAVTAHRTGTMKAVTSDVTFNDFLYVTEQCATGMNPGVPYLACANAQGDGPTGGETLRFPVTAGETYHLFIDGAGISNTQGPFRVTLSYE